MDYKVILSDFAKQQLDDILFYICITLCNETAARGVLQDAENTIQKLSQSGVSLKLCEEPQFYNLNRSFIPINRLPIKKGASEAYRKVDC